MRAEEDRYGSHHELPCETGTNDAGSRTRAGLGPRFDASMLSSIRADSTALKVLPLLTRGSNEHMSTMQHRSAPAVGSALKLYESFRDDFEIV